MMQWQKKRDFVICAPSPAINQRGNLRFDIRVGRDHTLGFASRSAGKNHQRPAIGRDDRIAHAGNLITTMRQ